MHKPPIPSTQTPGNIASRLDAEMSEILYSPLLKDEREKWKMYHETRMGGGSED